MSAIQRRLFGRAGRRSLERAGIGAEHRTQESVTFRLGFESATSEEAATGECSGRARRSHALGAGVDVVASRALRWSNAFTVNVSE
jgi:hypothetical protein